MRVRDLERETELALPALMKRKLKDDPGASHTAGKRSYKNGVKFSWWCQTIKLQAMVPDWSLESSCWMSGTGFEQSSETQEVSHADCVISVSEGFQALLKQGQS